ncbi:hypothetical protein [Myxosarcina sp. GI1]|uniref:5'-methylthioadenosine/S-adenosylhomocysteine nucleosidase family protein n=1 Tax=Myxosarcina sp. GI1 TaxID=1541065 RepID=UPI000569AD44|nr:hypothetical protein [Myxosarcina sp. GI1]
MNRLINIILVARGAEYQAVCRGLKQAKCNQQKVVAIPIGINNIKRYLEAIPFGQPQPQSALLMGLCGSLTWQYRVGDKVLYQSCNYHDRTLVTDESLTHAIWQKLSKSVALANSVTSDRPICLASEKLRLGNIYPNSVVDMEGFAYLQALQKRGVAVAMLRTVSDDLTGDIPNLARAIDDKGNLKTFDLAIAMLQQPIAATRLIKGSLIGLKALQQITAELFSS